MKFNSLLPALVSGVTLSSTFLAGVLPATAVTLDYSLNGTFGPSPSSGEYSGTFSVDSVTQSLTAYSITTSSTGGFGGNTYTFGAPNNFGSLSPSGSEASFCTASFRCFSEGSSNFNLQFDGSTFNPPPSGVLNVIPHDNSGNSGPFQSSEKNCFFGNFCQYASQTRFVESGTATTQPIPEPLSIIGTLIGGGAVWRMRKKLTTSTKAKVKQ